MLLKLPKDLPELKPGVENVLVPLLTTLAPKPLLLVLAPASAFAPLGNTVRLLLEFPDAVKPLALPALAEVVAPPAVGVAKLLAEDEALAPGPEETAMLPAPETTPVLLSPVVKLKPLTITTPGTAGTVMSAAGAD